MKLPKLSPIDPDKLPDDFWPACALVVVLGSLALGQCCAPRAAHAATLSAVPAWQPFLGAAGPSWPAVAPSAEHARAWVTSAAWTGSELAVVASVGPSKVDDLTALLWCETRPDVAVLQAVATWPASAPQANRSRTLRLRRGAATLPGGACRVALAWHVGRGWYGGLVADAPSIAPSSAAKSAGTAASGGMRAPMSAAASLAAASLAAVPAASSADLGPITSLPWRLYASQEWVPARTVLEVCYLPGASTIPNSRFFPPTRCTDPRSSVDLGTWCAALRALPAEAGADPAVVASTKAACR